MIIYFLIVAFLAVILLLTSMLLFVKAKISPKGKVVIDINDGEKTLEVDGGGTLLGTLGSSGIFLPSACGGGGTCSQCKCQVLEGGGSILAAEESHFNSTQQKDGWRLSCQVPVKNDLKINVPEDVFGVKEWECEVISNENVATFSFGGISL
jgi:Na+-transporting NADH:ubiquinone oxidoreductase subunit F